MAGGLDKLRAHLLPKTLEHAVANSPFYAAHLGEGWREVTSVADLVRLPVLEKALAVEHQSEMRCGLAPEDFGAVSSGTTRVGQELFRVERSPHELAALEDFREMMAEVHAAAREAGAGETETRETEPELPPRVLHVITPNHGLPSAPPPSNTMRLAWSYSKNVVQMIAQALAERDDDGRQISVLRMSVSALKQMTVQLLVDGEDFSRFGLQSIGTNAAMVSTRWRRILEQTWGAKVFDNYSLSEIVTPATECASCGWYHFGEPPLVFEVLEPTTGAQLEAGVGHLVLTGLFPYVQRQPLIRYATGDLVELGPWCDEVGDRGLRFVGRRHQTLHRARADGSGTEMLLFPSRLEDVLDEIPEVARHKHPYELVEGTPPYQVGFPKYRASFEGNRVEVGVGVLFLPQLFPEAEAHLVRHVSEEMLRMHTDLRAAVEAGELSLTVVLEPAFDDDKGRWQVKYLM